MLGKLARFIKFTLLLLVFAALTLFIASNHELVTVSLFPLPFEITLPLALISVLTFALGIVCTGLALSVKIHRYKREAAIHKHKNNALQNELNALKDQHKLAQLNSMPAFPAKQAANS